MINLTKWQLLCIRRELIRRGALAKNTSWTLDECKKEALRFTSRSEWQTNSRKTYEKARIEKWLDECCKHMAILKIKNRPVINLVTKEIFKSCREADRFIKKTKGVQRAIRLSIKCGGYHWAYCDKNGKILKS